MDAERCGGDRSHSGSRLDNMLRVVTHAPGFPHELITAGALDRIRALASSVPGEVDAFGFECRLAEGESRVDLGTFVTAASRGPLLLAALQHAGPGQEFAQFAAASWQGLRRFCEAWMEKGSALNRRVPFLFLEFDAEGSPEPGVFFRIEPPLTAMEMSGSKQRSIDWITDRALPALLDRPLAGGVRRSVARCVSALPRGGRILHIAAMPGRSASAVRLFASVPVDHIRNYSRSIGWRGDGSLIESISDRYGTDSKGCRKAIAELQFDVAEDAGLRLGIEFSSARRGDVECRADWSQLLARLVQDGLCTTRKRDALMRWPRVYQATTTPRGWPCRFVQRLSHIKIVSVVGRALEAKAYFHASAELRLFK